MGITKIGWTRSKDGTQGYTWNPISGCSKVSPGCAHCYAETVSHRFSWTTKPWTASNAPVNVQWHPDRLDRPFRWKKGRLIFVNSMSDLFHEVVPDAWIDAVFAVMAMNAQHTYQILTKRPQRMLDYVTDPQTVLRIAEVIDRMDDRRGYDVFADDLRGGAAWPLHDVWLGVSVEDQRRADERIPLLLQTPADVRFLSCEPLLGPVDLSAIPLPMPGGDPVLVNALHRTSVLAPRVDWVIVGAESGPGARPMDDEWVRTLRDQCQDTGAAFFFKQRAHSGHKEIDPVLDGRQWLEMPGWS